jgi:hypothetical protein
VPKVRQRRRSKEDVHLRLQVRRQAHVIKKRLLLRVLTGTGRLLELRPLTSPHTLHIKKKRTTLFFGVDKGKAEAVKAIRQYGNSFFDGFLRVYLLE